MKLRSGAQTAFRAILAASVLVIGTYAIDWAVWKVRASRGRGLDEVEVTRVSVASLKGNKEEYFADGTDTMTCSRSLLPVVGGTQPCWWLRRHTQVVERY